MNRILAFFASSYLLVSILPHAVEGVGFKYNRDAYCDYPAHIAIDSMSCINNKTCENGDIMLVQGTIGLLEELEDTYMCTTTQACFVGLNGICETYSSVIYNVCGRFGLNMTWYEENECPSEGDYSMEAYFQVPYLDDLPLNASKCDLRCVLVCDL